MADEQAPETQTTDATQEAPAANVKTFTQDEVNRLVGKARQEARSSALKEKGQEKPTAAVEKTDDGGDRLTMKQLAEQNAKLQRKMEFRDLADEHGIRRDARADLFDLYEVQKPDDPASWIQSKAKLFGNGEQVSKEPATKPTEPAKPPAAAPMAPSTPVNPVTAGGLVNPFAMTEAQLEAMSPMELRGHVEKIIDSHAARSGAPPRPQPRK